jgi:hypothetical protein
MLEWRLVGRGLRNPQILARDKQGGVLAINRVVSSGLPDKWWLTGPNYGLGTEHDSQAEAKAAAQHWADTANAPIGRTRSPEPPACRSNNASGLIDVRHRTPQRVAGLAAACDHH